MAFEPGLGNILVVCHVVLIAVAQLFCLQVFLIITTQHINLFIGLFGNCNQVVATIVMQTHIFVHICHLVVNTSTHIFAHLKCEEVLQHYSYNADLFTLGSFFSKPQIGPVQFLKMPLFVL